MRDPKWVILHFWVIRLFWVFGCILGFWLHFGFLVAFWVFGCILGFWLHFGFLVAFWVFGCKMKTLRIRQSTAPAATDCLCGNRLPMRQVDLEKRIDLETNRRRLEDDWTYRYSNRQTSAPKNLKFFNQGSKEFGFSNQGSKRFALLEP
jgi:hypothetical protein